MAFALGVLKWTPDVADATDVNMILMARDAHYDAERRLFTTIYASQGISVKPPPKQRASVEEIRAWSRRRQAAARAKERSGSKDEKTR